MIYSHIYLKNSIGHAKKGCKPFDLSISIMAVKINSGIKVSKNEQCIEWKIDYMVKEQSFVASFAFSISTAVMAVVGGPQNLQGKKNLSLTLSVCVWIFRKEICFFLTFCFLICTHCYRFQVGKIQRSMVCEESSSE
jgi:hypothetical protein